MRQRGHSARSRAMPVPGSDDGISGWRFIGLLDEELGWLRANSAHRNRVLFLDHVVIAHLLAFFNPAVKSLRKIEDVFEVSAVRKRLRTPRMPKSTLAEAQRLFDPALLLPLIESLKARVAIGPHDQRLDNITRKILAVDGSFFAVAPRITWALFNQCAARRVHQGQVRGHFHFDLLRGIPDRVQLTDGQALETQQLQLALEPNCLYVLDRGFTSYDLFVQILESNSDFVVRLRKSACFEIVEERPLSAADRTAGVISDAVVRVGWRRDQPPLHQPLRRIEGTYIDRNGEPQHFILLTNRLDLSAEIIALLYRHRWQIELFFRWLKCMVQFQHFFSESLTAMTLQMYVAMIATLLIAIHTGAKPSSYDCLLYTSPSPRDGLLSRMPSSA